MRVRRTTVPAILMTIGLALAAAGCGGSAAATPNATILGADFATSALAACDAAVVMKKAEGPFPFPDFNPTKPDVAKLGQVADYIEKTATTYEAWSAAMKALGQPAGGGSSWSALVAAVDRHGQLARDQIDAARKGDTTRFSNDYTMGMQTRADLIKAATDAGIPDCAKFDG